MSLGDGFDTPQEVDDVLVAFPAQVSHLMPPWESIPEEFQRSRTPWNRFVSDWFFNGWEPGEKWNLHISEEVDPQAAFRHLLCVMGSFEPKHEHKEAAVAWLLSRWFADLEEVST